MEGTHQETRASEAREGAGRGKETWENVGECGRMLPGVLVRNGGKETE